MLISRTWRTLLCCQSYGLFWAMTLTAVKAAKDATSRGMRFMLVSFGPDTSN